MNPWDILGWILVGIMGLFLVGVVLFILVGVAARCYTTVTTRLYDRRKATAHRKKWQETRLTPPAPGQHWKAANGTWGRVRSVEDEKVTYYDANKTHVLPIASWQPLVDNMELALLWTRGSSGV